MDNHNQSFEALMQEIKNIIASLEGKDLPIDEAIKQFEQGIKLTRLADQQLKNIKDKVTKIVREGNVSDFQVEGTNEK